MRRTLREGEPEPLELDATGMAFHKCLVRKATDSAWQFQQAIQE